MSNALDKRTTTAVAQTAKILKAKDRRAAQAQANCEARISRAQADYFATMREIWAEPETQEETPAPQETTAPPPA